MKPFSRTLSNGSSAPDDAAIGKTIEIAAFVGIGYLVLRSFLEWGSDAVFGYLFFAAFLTFLIASHYLTERKLRALIAARPDDSICTFARSFDRRKVDPWVIRAVYNELQARLSRKDGPFPIRAADNLWKDLLIDEDDVDLDMLEDLPPLLGRSLDDIESNSYCGHVQTVEDLVLFFNALPMESPTRHQNSE